ncbi:MAG: redoxin domain-containing protein [Bacteroidales bacterium]|nr:redoxin domain-containing protein [Bacteroidales bacterium]
MRRFAFLAIVAFLFTQCNKNEVKPQGNPEFVVSGNFTGTTDSLVFLQDYVDGEWIVLDSTPIVEGLFEFRGEFESPKVLYIALKGGKRKYLNFFTDNASISITAHADSLKNAAIIGSKVNDEYAVYQDSISKFEVRSQELYQQYLAAQENQDPAQIKKIEAEYEIIYEKQQDFSQNYVWNNNASYISPYIVIRSLSHSLEYSELDSFLQHFDASISNSIYFQQIEDRVRVLKSVAIGMEAPEIELADTAGLSSIKLSDYRGKYVLIDFWASWCRPCRKDNPGNLALYKEFKDKGFEIFGVAFDQTKEDWVEAIAQDGITWPQVSDLKYWNCAAGKTYGVRSIPHTVLIDPQGIIIAKNIRGEELRTKVESLF